jgi:hypothetical protein
MFEDRILSNPRQLSKNELVKVENAKSKWYPKIIQTYNTTLYEMMASPYKKALVQGIIFSIILVIYGYIDYKFKLNYLFDKGKINNIAIIVIVVILIISIGSTAMAQYKLNDNLFLFLTLTLPGATKYDYESSSVIQSKLMRNSVRSGSSGGGSSLMGGVIGGAIGSRMGSSRRRR